MRIRHFKTAVLIAALTALMSVPMLMHRERPVFAQGYSGAMPNVAATAATGLGITYTAGTVVSGGTQTAITGSTLTATDAMTSCAAPAYSACNFVYWNSGASLSITTTAATAFAPGNVVIAFVTTSGGNITVVTPASWAPYTAGLTTTPTGANNTAGAYWIGPGNCWYSTSNGTLTTPTFGAAPGNTALGLNTAGASFVPVMQIATTNAAVASLNTISCVINPPSTVGVTGRGVTVQDVVVMYGIQQNGVNATQVAVEASGTLNGVLVFDKVAFPTPAAGETASTVTPVRADSGTITLTPAKASFNAGVSTAGAFYSQKIAPGAAFTMNTDLTVYHVNFTVLCTTTVATTINVAGILVHFTS
jgi:hypothetical protein